MVAFRVISPVRKSISWRLAAEAANILGEVRMTPTMLKRFVALALVILAMAPASQAFAGRPSSTELSQGDKAASSRAAAQDMAMPAPHGPQGLGQTASSRDLLVAGGILSPANALRALEMLPPLQSRDRDDDNCNSPGTASLEASFFSNNLSGTLEGQAGPPYDHDWIRLSVRDSGLLRLTLTTQVDSPYDSLELYSSPCPGRLIESSYPSYGYDAEVTLKVNAGEVYNIQVNNFGGYFGGYTLKAIVETAGNDLADDTCGQAGTTILNAGPNQFVNGMLDFKGDEDWVQVYAPQAGYVVITLGLVVPANVQYDLQVYDDSCTFLEQSTNPGVAEKVQVYARANGYSFRVRIFSAGNDSGGLYQLKAQSVGLDVQDDNCQDAGLWAYDAGTDVLKKLDYAGDDDWMRIRVNQAGILKLTLIPTGGRDYALEVYNDTCSQKLAGSDRLGSANEEAEVTLNDSYVNSNGAVRVHVYSRVNDFDVNVQYRLQSKLTPGQPLSIPALSLNDVDNSPFQYLSADDHTYYGGNTRIHGLITIRGAASESLTTLQLQVLQNGVTRATANLAAYLDDGNDANGELIGPTFGSDGQISLDNVALLFELPSAQAAQVDDGRDGTLALRVHVVAASGQQLDYNVPGQVQLLARYDGGNRYGPRDGDVCSDEPTHPCGGDDWTRPSTIEAINHFSGVDGGLVVGDFSNMNGGRFPDHASHQTGVDVDAWFPGYNNRDAAVANALIQTYLNDPFYGSQIERIWVSFTDAFRTAIQNVTLADGCLASAVLTDDPAGRHGTHFHIRFGTRQGCRRAPGMPNLLVPRVQGTTADLEWQTPADVGNGPIQGYVVVYKLEQQSWNESTQVALAAAATSHLLSQLQELSGYDVRLSAHNTFGAGPAAQRAFRTGRANLPLDKSYEVPGGQADCDVAHDPIYGTETKCQILPFEQTTLNTSGPIKLTVRGGGAQGFSVGWSACSFILPQQVAVYRRDPDLGYPTWSGKPICWPVGATYWLAEGSYDFRSVSVVGGTTTPIELVVFNEPPRLIASPHAELFETPP